MLSEDFRVLQFTPTGSDASIIFGTGVTSAVPGSAGNLLLAVSDIEAARADLMERGVDVSEVFHGTAFSADASRRLPGPIPSVAEPGVAALAELLLETAEHHDRFEKAAPADDWWDWYAAYLAAREHGSTPEQADAAADRYMAETHGVVTSR